LIFKQLHNQPYFTLLFTCTFTIGLYLCGVNNNKHYKKMRKSHTLLPLLAGAMLGTEQISVPFINTSSPIFTPTKHTVESYRSQQRKAKQRRKAR